MTPRELLAISLAISRDFAPRFARLDKECQSPIAFSAHELLAISQEISREFSPRRVESPTKLVLLPVDPRRLHAYWHLAEPKVSKPAVADTNTVADQSEPIAEQRLTLRIFTASEPADKAIDKPEQPGWLDIPINSGQCRQDVILPADTSLTGPNYSAAIGVSQGERGFVAIAYSNIAVIPNPTVEPERSGLTDAIRQYMIPAMNTLSSSGKAVPHKESMGTR